MKMNFPHETAARKDPISLAPGADYA